MDKPSVLKCKLGKFLKLKKVLDAIIPALIQGGNIQAQNFMKYVRERSAKLEHSKRTNVDQIQTETESQLSEECDIHIQSPPRDLFVVPVKSLEFPL